MGAINNAFNQAAGAVATAAYGIEKIKESQLAEGETAKNELVHLNEVEIPELDKNFEAAETKEKKLSKDVDAMGDLLTAPGAIKTRADSDAYNELSKEVSDEYAAAHKALETLRLKISAKEDMRRRIEKAIKRANNWRGR